MKLKNRTAGLLTIVVGLAFSPLAFGQGFRLPPPIRFPGPLPNPGLPHPLTQPRPTLTPTTTPSPTPSGPSPTRVDPPSPASSPATSSSPNSAGGAGGPPPSLPPRPIAVSFVEEDLQKKELLQQKVKECATALCKDPAAKFGLPRSAIPGAVPRLSIAIKEELKARIEESKAVVAVTIRAKVLRGTYSREEGEVMSKRTSEAATTKTKAVEKAKLEVVPESEQDVARGKRTVQFSSLPHDIDLKELPDCASSPTRTQKNMDGSR